MRTDPPFSRWMVVGLCFLSQNMAIGFTFGSFGPLLVSTEAQFGISRSAATMGMSVLNLALGGLAPLLGGLVQKFPIRYMMSAGALISAVGYLGLSMLTYYPLSLAMFVLVGAGVSLCGVIGPLTLVSRWFPTGRATALSIANLPVALLLTPYVVGATLPDYGRSTILAAAAAIFLVLAAMFLLLRDHPPTSALLLRNRENDASGSPHEPTLGARDILSSRPFWLVSLAMGLMAGTGTIFVVHIVPFGLGKGMDIQTASTLLSLYAGAGLLGVLLYGRVADWIGPVNAFVSTSFFQMVLWSALLVADTRSLFILSALMGVMQVPMSTLHGAALGRLIPVSSISRAMGLSYAIKLPFTFSFAVGAALVFEMSGSYILPFALTTGLVAICCGLFLAVSLDLRAKSVMARTN